MNPVNQHDMSYDYGTPLDQGTLTASSFANYVAETGLLEDTPEPLPLTDTSLGVNKPVAFNISMSKTQPIKSRKKSTIKKLKKNQLTLHEMEERSRRSSRTPSRPPRSSSNKRNFSERESPSNKTNIGNKPKVFIKEHVLSSFSEYPSLPVASEKPA